MTRVSRLSQCSLTVSLIANNRAVWYSSFKHHADMFTHAADQLSEDVVASIIATHYDPNDAEKSVDQFCSAMEDVGRNGLQYDNPKHVELAVKLEAIYRDVMAILPQQAVAL